MNFQAFNLDTESAKKADSEGGRISQTGKYVGTILRAEFVQSKGGTHGIEVVFTTEDKLEATSTFWTFKADGTPIFGRDKVNALMACASVKTLTPTETTIEKYSFEAGGKILQPATVAPELEGKPIGLLIQMEEYLNNNGEVKTRANIVSAFNPANNLMAKEILERKTTPEALEKAYARLMKNGDKKLQGQAPAQGGGYGSAAPVAQAADLDDDLPF